MPESVDTIIPGAQPKPPDLVRPQPPDIFREQTSKQAQGLIGLINTEKINGGDLPQKIKLDTMSFELVSPKSRQYKCESRCNGVNIVLDFNPESSEYRYSLNYVTDAKGARLQRLFRVADDGAITEIRKFMPINTDYTLEAKKGAQDKQWEVTASVGKKTTIINVNENLDPKEITVIKSEIASGMHPDSQISDILKSLHRLFPDSPLPPGKKRSPALPALQPTAVPA